MDQNAPIPHKRVHRVTRSISFEPEIHAYIAAEAQRLQRSFNWVVNDMVRQEIARRARSGDARASAA
jgi:predicted HicB family RNase H-like nuclease